MHKRFRRLFTLVIVLQFITLLFHLLSLFNKKIPTTADEKLLFDLMGNYQFDLGLGFNRTIEDFMSAFSISFALLLFFSGAINLFLLKSDASKQKMIGLILINLFTYFLCFITMVFTTFLPPIVCLGLIVLFLSLSYLTLKKQRNETI